MTCRRFLDRWMRVPGAFALVFALAAGCGTGDAVVVEADLPKVDTEGQDAARTDAVPEVGHADTSETASIAVVFIIL